MQSPSSASPAPSGPVARGRLATLFSPDNDYFKLSTTFAYSYLFVLPLVVLYELGVVLVNSGAATEIRVSSDIYIKRLLALVGIEGTLVPSILLVVVGAGVVLYQRRRNAHIRPRYFAYMFGESLVYGVVIGMVVATFVSHLFSLQWPPMLQEVTGKPSLAQGLVLSLGAGVYEELVFRLLLVSALVWALRLFDAVKQNQRYLVAAVIGALVFSAVHYIGALGDVFTLQSFVFRFLMGAALNVLFLWRGFGIAAMTHALYDVIVTLMHGG